MENKINFIKESIYDIQSTIRVIDTKVGVVFLILLAPLSNIGKIANHCVAMLSKTPVLISFTLLLGFLFFWASALYLAARVISAIDNPSDHIDMSGHTVTGVYYSGGLYNATFRDVWFNTLRSQSKLSFNNHLENFPADYQQIEKELVYEQMKLVYIREVKFSRLNSSISMIRNWLFFGAVIYLVSRFL
ncbi:hypothetical protein RJ45_10250 [Photobacterium gaetbulicola]|uniref:Uncharacterized protein n=1 Tax=Photobacterium gaetbulicola TaxID=1295392 RepID=A0A0B9G4V0_9GAMM|nr:hypothetical protein [Photobacterium gaetbulicola]KHT63723.1 hypothetical protein RJ45_10250 [Photobacterium gaetbulicola]